MSQRNDFLQFAISQIGMKGGAVVRKWYNENITNIGDYNWPWCAAGVSYCANKAGIPQTIISPSASSSTILQNFKNLNRFKKRGTYTPKGGDIIIFKWAYNTTTPASHVGIVEKFEKGYVHTIEFNSGSSSDGAVARWKYLPDNTTIVGYCVPDFKENMVEIVKKKSYIRKYPWFDLKYNSSPVLKTLKVGTKVTYLEDDTFGWSKIKYGNTTGYIQNIRLSKTGISKYPITQLKKAKKAKLVRENKSKDIPANKNMYFICSIEKGKNKGKSIVSYKGSAVYVSTSNLKNLIKR